MAVFIGFLSIDFIRSLIRRQWSSLTGTLANVIDFDWLIDWRLPMQQLSPISHLLYVRSCFLVKVGNLVLLKRMQRDPRAKQAITHS